MSRVSNLCHSYIIDLIQYYNAHEIQTVSSSQIIRPEAISIQSSSPPQPRQTFRTLKNTYTWGILLNI
jgi:hypothetical protein